MRTVMWLLLLDDTVVVFTILGYTANGFVEALLCRSGSHMSFGRKVGITIGTTACVVVLQYCVGAFVRVISSSGDGPDRLL
jgi:hypothetical protein